MSMLTTYTKNKVLDHIFRTAAFSQPGAIYCALFTTLPNDAGSGGVEVSGGAYARQAVASFNSSSAGFVSNVPYVDFTATGATWSNIIGVGIYDAASGGNLLTKAPIGSTVGQCVGSLATDIFTCYGHAMLNTDSIVLSGLSLPGGFSEDTRYYVRDVTTDTFKLALTSGGAAVDLTSNGGATIFKLSPITVNSGSTLRLSPGNLSFQL